MQAQDDCGYLRNKWRQHVHPHVPRKRRWVLARFQIFGSPIRVNTPDMTSAGPFMLHCRSAHKGSRSVFFTYGAREATYPLVVRIQQTEAMYSSTMSYRAQTYGLFWELNPGPLAPEARIIPLDYQPDERTSAHVVQQLSHLAACLLRAASKKSGEQPGERSRS